MKKLPILKLSKSEAHEELVKEYPEYFQFENGIEVVFESIGIEGFRIIQEKDCISIQYNNLNSKYRALGQSISFPELKEIQQKPEILFRGLFVEASRNGVPRTVFLKKLHVKLALLGINYVVLHTEDVYQVEDHPLIGYKRGAYTKDEIKEIVRYAELFGIEVFPCIQTLGHLSQILKFDSYWGLRDNKDVINVSHPQVYEFLETLIKNATEPYKSKYIHLGMDETYGLGRGESFRVNAKIDPLKIYLKHLKLLTKICEKYKLKPIIWSDIIMGEGVGFIGGSGHFSLSDKQFKALPKTITLNYWNYFSYEVDRYKLKIQKHRERNFEPMLSPTFWSWNRFWALYPRFEMTAIPLLKAAKQSGLKQVLMTMWGDDGQEAPLKSCLAGICIYAEHCWKNEPIAEDFSKVVRGVIREEIESFILPSNIDFIDEDGLRSGSNMAKCFLYDDPLLRLYASHAGSRKFFNHFSTLASQLKEILQNCSSENKKLFTFIFNLVNLLSKKADIGNNACKAYLAKDLDKLKEIIEESMVVEKMLYATWQSHRDIWLEEYKPFGLEVLDRRYGGTITRMQIFRHKLEQFINKEIEVIEEFDEPHQDLWENFTSKCLKYDTLESITTEK